MKIVSLLRASLATLLLAACLAHAADSKPVSRVMSIIEIQTDDPSGYAAWIKEYNAVAKAKLGIDQYLRVYETVFDGKAAGRVRAVVTATSVAELTKNNAALENDPAIVQNREHLRAIRKMGSRVLYQALRFDGRVPNSWTYTTLATITDEAGYLKAVEQLRSLFDSNGFNDAKIGVYRTIAGRTDHSHRVTISLPSQERLGAFLDLAATNQALIEWIANTAKIRTVVSNTTAREITK